MSPLWRIEMLGRLRLVGADRVIAHFRTQKACSLLALLAYYPHRAHPRGELIEILWPESYPEVGRRNLRVALTSLRRQAEPPDVLPGTVIVADRAGVHLNAEVCATDVALFEAALQASAQTGSLPEKQQRLMEAAELYRGELLPGFFDDWILAERERLLEGYLTALGELAACSEKAGDPHGAIQWARRAVVTDPLREEAHRNLIRLLAAAGYPVSALRQYQELERLLRVELRAAPEAALRALAGELEAKVASAHLVSLPAAELLVADRSPPRPASAQPAPPLMPSPKAGAGPGPGTPGALPPQLTRFFGREAEIERLCETLSRRDEGRGMKAEVKPIRSHPPSLASRPARLVTLTGPGGTGKTRLAQEAGARLSERFGATITFAGFPPSRPYPSPADLLQCASVALFVDRAQAVRPDFQLTASNALTVTRLCACLEGLPLSIELAAARIGVLTASQMLTRLAPPGAPAEGERFGLLATRRRVADWRHQSLRATMDWSYRLLAPELQRFFARLSVFRRGWSLEAAEAVCGDLGAAGAAESSQYATLDYLEQLRDSSLVIAEERPPGMRYRLLETLREYGRERLREAGEAEATSERHACYFLSLVEQAEPELMGLGQAEWLARLDEEQDNLRAALAWCQAVPGHREIGLRMVGALFWFWWIRCYHREGRRWSESILARTGGAPGIPAAEACHSAALRTLARARACLTAGGMIWADGSAAHARPLMEEGVAIARECGEPGPLAHALRFLGWVVLDQQDFIAARSIMEESLHLHRRMENQIHIGRSLNFLATLARVQGDYSEAERLWEEVSEVSRQAGDQWAVALSLAGRAKVRLLHGDRDPARALYEQALKLRREIGDVRGIAECLEGLAEMACADGEMERTARLLGAADAVREAVGHAVIPTDWPIARERPIAAARGHLGDAAFAAAWAQGRALSAEQAVAEALRKPEG